MLFKFSFFFPRAFVFPLRNVDARNVSKRWNRFVLVQYDVLQETLKFQKSDEEFRGYQVVAVAFID